MLTVALIAFTVIRFVGDPLESIASQETRLEERQELKERLGLNKPVYLQFLSFIQRGLVGDFGLSYKQQEPVSRMIIEKLPATIELAITSSLIALIGGGILGVYAALRPKTRLTAFIM
ncbi:MAG: Glutathione transport system permease protein GsiC [Xylophilus sp.]|nr:MAG: Glutathione transport system permease protein GsiC [Xylophilus sp.]